MAGFFALQKNPLGMLLFVADNFAYFPYSIMEEPLFVLHHIDLTLSVSGASILQSFKEVSHVFKLLAFVFGFVICMPDI